MRSWRKTAGESERGIHLVSWLLNSHKCLGDRHSSGIRNLIHSSITLRMNKLLKRS